jgi:hypothetical protein
MHNYTTFKSKMYDQLAALEKNANISKLGKHGVVKKQSV